MTMLDAWIEGIGVIGPGMPDWPAARAALRGDVEWSMQPLQLPAPALLPPAERRRTGVSIKLALGVGMEAVAASAADLATLPTVFTASGADGDNCHTICEALASHDRLISPTRFHNSVHNAPSGYWGIATGAMSASTSLCAYDASFGAGLLEALTWLAAGEPRVLLVAYDSLYPEPLHAKRPLATPFGVALLLAAARSERALARLSLALSDAPADTFGATPLEALRTGVPAARSLPLLARLARDESGRVVLDYLDSLRLEVQVEATKERA